jgi:aspartate kinase
MRSSPEIFCTFLKALSDADVELDLVDISETSVGAVTHADRLADAERAVRRAFGMTPADEATAAGHEGHLTPAAGPPLQTWVPISGQDMTPVPAGDRTVARHF